MLFIKLSTVSLKEFTIKIIVLKVSQLFLGNNYVFFKNQLKLKSFPGGFLRKSIFSILGEKFHFCCSGFGLEPLMGPKMDQMSCYMNFHDRKCCEDHFEYSQISVGPVEPEILKKN